MIVKQYPFTLDFSKLTKVPRIEITQNDTESHEFRITLKNNGASVDLTGLTYTITTLLSNGNNVIGSLVPDGQILSYKPSTELEVDGKCKCTIEVYEGLKRLTTYPFEYYVKSELYQGTIEADSAYPILTSLIEEVNSMVPVNGTNGQDGYTPIKGVDYFDGADGQDGVGVPTGGTTGQVLSKKTNTDYDTEWINVTIESAYVNIEDFGAVGDGTTDNTTFIQDAIDSIASTGGIIFVPIGIYLCNGLKLYSNITLFGAGFGSILKQKAGLTGYKTLIGINHGGAGEGTGEGDTSLFGTIHNVVIKDLQLRGRIDTEAFSEFINLITITSCSNVRVENVFFNGFRGDGFFCGNLNQEERHIQGVVISNCIFDGINKNNRNAISIVEGRDIIVEKCVITRCTRDDMPGAIDVEPDTNATQVFGFTENITLRDNLIYDIGFNGITISIRKEQSYRNHPAQNIKILNNTIDTCVNSGIELYQLSATQSFATKRNNYIVSGNTVKNTALAIVANGIHGLDVYENVFRDSVNGFYLGNTDMVLEATVRNNTFENLGIGGTACAILIRRTSYIKFIKNMFMDITNTAFRFFNNTSDHIVLDSNIVQSPLAVTTRFTLVDGTHTLTRDTNIVKDNDYSTFTNNDITNNYRALSATTGTISLKTEPLTRTLTPTGDCTINNTATTGIDLKGKFATFAITTSGTTSYTITFGTGFRPNGTLATGTVTAKKFYVLFMFDGSNWVEISRTTAI